MMLSNSYLDKNELMINNWQIYENLRLHENYNSKAYSQIITHLLNQQKQDIFINITQICNTRLNNIYILL